MDYKSVAAMLRSLTLATLALVASLVVGCASTYRLPPTPGTDASAEVEGGHLRAAESRFRATLCKGIDLRPQYDALDEQSLISFLKAQGFDVRAARARSDLVFLELRAAPEAEPVRLRVAILNTVPQAGQELHAAVREHGRGAWGVHRANLAVLIPEGRLDAIVAFAAKTRLACWGVVTVGDGDEAYVIPGGYREL